MNRMPVRMIATALVVWILVMPRGLAAGERRGANLVVTRLDGTRVSGELIAVKPASLLLLADSAGASVELSDIKSVRILRPSKAGLFAGLAGAAGFIGGALAGLKAWHDEEDQLAYGAIAGLYLGAIGAVSGLFVGGIQGVDSTFSVAGQPEWILATHWRKLAGLSREGRLPEAPVVHAAGPERSGPRPRFRLNIGAAFDSVGSLSREAQGSFRFPGEAPPEAGPYSASFRQWSDNRGRSFRPDNVGLGYELAPRVVVEAEYFFLRNRWSHTWGDLEFTSSLDGRPYRGTGMALIEARFSGLLVGLALRPLAPSALERHIVEIGAAAGPARARGTVSLHPAEVVGRQAFGKTALAGRVRASYDFYPVPAVSIGAVVDWRFVQANLSGLTSSGTANYVEDVEGSTAAFLRLTEVAFPPLAVRATGLYWGLRLGVRI